MSLRRASIQKNQQEQKSRAGALLRPWLSLHHLRPAPRADRVKPVSGPRPHPSIRKRRSGVWAADIAVGKGAQPLARPVQSSRQRQAAAPQDHGRLNCTAVLGAVQEAGALRQGGTALGSPAAMCLWQVVFLKKQRPFLEIITKRRKVSPIYLTKII